MSNKNLPDWNNPASDNINGLPANTNDAMLTCNIEAPAPLPCIVILIHGVNDVGEAFPNLDKGICNGLNKRLGRCDLKPNKWQWTLDNDDDFSPRMQMFTEWEETKEVKPPLKPNSVKHRGNSPVIPFYWGYRPVDIDTYYTEQEAYEARSKNNEAKELPYDTYWIEQETKEMAKNFGFSKLNHDQFGNWIDYHFTRNGGPFSDATTCIPDMYGPGFSSFTNQVGEMFSSNGAKIYYNPHRIYMVFAARRLANLIKKIREDEKLKDAPVNIIAHSQGTIITMLANMMLKEEGFLTADCVILAHSPYAFDYTFLESQSKESGMGVQTCKARQETFINFVQAINDGQELRKNKYNKPETLIEKGVASIATKPDLLNPSKPNYDFTNPLYCRYNFGKVYNYFCPNDHVVSLRSVEGMGWQGIPNNVFNRCANNLRQRVFSHRIAVGEDPDKLICFRPKGSFEIELPEYLDSKALKNRNIKIITNYYDSPDNLSNMHVYLTKDELALINQHDPIKNGTYTAAYYDNYKDKLVLIYTVNDEIITQLEKDKENGIFSPIETGSATIFDTDFIKNARYEVKEKLKINGERVPEPIIFTGCGKSYRTKLAKAIYYNDLYLAKNHYNEYVREYKRTDDYQVYPKYEFYYRDPDKPKRRIAGNDIVDSTYYYPWPRDRLNEHPEWVANGFAHFRFTSDPNKFEVWCWPSGDELHQKVDEYIKKQTEDQEESSHHSSITLHEQVPSHIMAYDLAIGVVHNAGKENRQTWQRLIHLADWRSPENEDSDTIKYKNYGILPDEIKKSMNLLQGSVPNGVVNEFENVKTIGQMAFLGFGKSLASIIPNPIAKGAMNMMVRIGDKVFEFFIDDRYQWPLPSPVTKGNVK